MVLQVAGRGLRGRFCAGQVIRAAERDSGSDPLLPVLAQEGQTPCRTDRSEERRVGKECRL